jgi:hypothetical protein
MQINLHTPIEQAGGTAITSVTLRKPSVGELRGVKLTNLLQMDVNTMLSVLPRITQPALLAHDIAAMDPADFMELAGQLVGFFMDPAQMQAAKETAQLA